MKFGHHIPLSRPLSKSFSELREGSAFQFFLGSNLSYANFKYSTSELLEAKEVIKERKLSPFIHAAYVHNFSSEDEEKRQKTIISAIRELDVGAILGAPVVFHIGSRVDKKLGLKVAIESFKEVLKTALSSTMIYAEELHIPLETFISQRKLLVENAAGEGSKIGSTPEELREFLREIPELGLCIDTCHLFSAGKLRREKITEDLNSLPRPTLIHLNDSKTKFGGCCDRHAEIFTGELFKTGEDLTELLRYAKLIGADIITETGVDEKEKIELFSK